MAGDVQLTALQQSAAPLDYVVPGSALIRVKSIRGEFTDNGAGADWLPAVQLISDSGHIIATASDQGSKVTAGGAADASFFPGAAKAAAASTSGSAISYARGYSNHSAGDPNISVLNNTHKAAPFAHVSTSNAAIMNWTTTTTTDDTLQLLGFGIYTVMASSQSDLGGGIIVPLIYDLNGTEVPQMSWDNLNSPAIGDPSGLPGDMAMAIVSTLNQGVNLQLQLQNASGGNRNCTLAAMGVIFHGTPA